MNLPLQVATLFRTFYFGGNWTDVNLKDSLNGVTWQQATTEVYSCNSIATLVYHTNYYVRIVSKVLLGHPLDGNDKESFKHPPVQSQEDWDNLLHTTFTDAENFARLIEQLPVEKFEEIFMNDKYGNYYRNIHGIIEHNHYHLGQIVLLKKIISQMK